MLAVRDVIFRADCSFVRVAPLFVVVLRVVNVSVLRALEFVVRTAAPAKPMHVQSATRKGSILLILSYHCDSSKIF